jgi:16S rRNA (cytidine1402-2'-O)-methyltransferase
LERLAIGGFTQLFMDTPFRSQSMLMDVLSTCNPETKLCIASDITLPSEKITTRTIKEWSLQLPNLSKKPCIFVLGR